MTVTAPTTASFSATATGTAPLSFQWQKNGVSIAGATGATYTTPATSTTGSGSTFRVVVSNGAGDALSPRGKTSRMRGMTAFVPVAAFVFGLAAANARPAAAQTTSLGSQVVVEGTVAMSVEDDFQSGRATKHYFLDQSGSGRRYDLRLTPRQASSVQPGMRVRVIGRLAGSVLTADQADDSVVVLDAPAIVTPGTAR